MLVYLIIGSIFYLIGALISGKIVKNQVKTWKALLSTFILLILWLWFLHFSYEANIPQTAINQASFGSAMLFFGLRSDKFLPDEKKKKVSDPLKGEAKKLFEKALENYETNNFHKAIEELLRANELQPNNKTILIGLAYNYSRTKDFPKAIDYMEKAIVSGYKNFDRIQTHGDFDELRKTELFQEFVENGYKQNQNTFKS